MNNEELAQLIRDVSAALESSEPRTVDERVKVLREHVAPGCHEGCGAQMDATDAGFRMQLEWYGGQLLSMVDAQQWFGINSWLNCTDKFTRRPQPPRGS